MNGRFKVLIAVIVFALLAVSLAACAPQAPAVDTAAQEAAAAAEAQLADMEAALAAAEAKAAEAESMTADELAAAQAELEAAKAAAEEAQAAADEAAAAAAAMVNTEVDFVTWYQYDETNEDEASDERVGNEYLRASIPQFNEAFEGQWNWVNRPKAWDKMYQELVNAVIAGNKVPDIIEMGSQWLNLVHKNGAVQDLRPWAEQQEWFDNLDSSALASCTASDGSLLCIPVAIRPHLTYVWADHYPDGYPTTPEEFIENAERLKAEGKFAWTYFGSTAYGGSGTSRMVWSLISSFGGTYDDGEGNMYLTSPETVAALEFLRMTVKEGYNPETVFAGGFVEEDNFKDASAGAIPTGLFGYRYINPLTAPDGTAYDKGNQEDMLDAIAAGDVILAPMFAPEGQTPGCGNEVQGFSIPVGAENIEAAYDYINWIMTPDQNPTFVLGPGVGFPANLSMLDAPELDLPFYREAAKALENSVCTPWNGSLERREEAQELIMQAIYKVVKEEPNSDIVAELTLVEEEYNSGN